MRPRRSLRSGCVHARRSDQTAEGVVVVAAARSARGASLVTKVSDGATQAVPPQNHRLWRWCNPNSARRHRKCRRYRRLRGGSRGGAAPFCRRGRAHMLALRNPLESGLKAISPHAVNFGEAAGRLPNTTLFAVEGMKAETAVIAFDLEGTAVSGAACSSGKCSPPMCLRSRRFPCARARRGACEPGLEHRRGRYRTLSCRLEKACKCAM
jgi:hypothetical protein